MVNKRNNSRVFVMAYLCISELFLISLLFRIGTQSIFLLLSLLVYAIFRVFYVKKLDIWRNKFSLLMLVYLELAVLGLPAISFGGNLYVFYSDSRFIGKAIGLGTLFLLVYSMSGYICSLLGKKQAFTRKKVIGCSPRIAHVFMLYCFLVAITVPCLIAAKLYNIGNLSYYATPLPFKLGGLINMYLVTAMPFMFLVCAHASHLAKFSAFSVISILSGALFSGVFQVIRLSKAFMVAPVVPVATYFIASNRLTRKIILVALFVVGGTVCLYPLLLDVRQVTTGSALSIEQYQVGSSVSSANVYDGLLAFYSRAFKDGYYLNKYVAHNEGSMLKARYNEVLRAGGSALYHTRAIDGYPPHIRHSSGSSFISDLYLFGGVFIVFTGAIAFGVLLHFSDRISVSHGAIYPVTVACVMYFLFRVLSAGPSEFFMPFKLESIAFLITPFFICFLEKFMYGYKFKSG